MLSLRSLVRGNPTRAKFATDNRLFVYGTCWNTFCWTENPEVLIKFSQNFIESTHWATQNWYITGDKPVKTLSSRIHYTCNCITYGIHYFSQTYESNSRQYIHMEYFYSNTMISYMFSPDEVCRLEQAVQSVNVECLIISSTCGNIGLIKREAPHVYHMSIMMTSNGNISALLAICAGNSPVTSEFPPQSLVTLSFDILFDMRLNKLLCKQAWGWWFEMIPYPLWCHCNDAFYASKSIKKQHWYLEESRWTSRSEYAFLAVYEFPLYR